MLPPSLKPGDCIEIVAPASRCEPERLTAMQQLFSEWQLQPRLDPEIFGQDLLCANTDLYRLNALVRAFQDPDIKAIVCVRGGYGSMCLLPKFSKLPAPKIPKWFVGISDITALHLHLQQQWQWPVLHANLAPSKSAPAALATAKAILFGEAPPHLEGTAINAAAAAMIHAPQTVQLIGGNLSIIQAGQGTLWQLRAANQWIVLEDIGERAYRLDRMLEQLIQGRVFENAAGVILGDFLEGAEPNGSTTLIQPVLARFAERLPIPVVQVNGIGHAFENRPVVLGAPCILDILSR